MIKKGMAFLVIFVMVAFSFAQEGIKGVRIKEMKGNAGKRWAICIGINDYENKSIIDLKKARNDARELGKVLEEYGQFDHVYVMTDDSDPRGENYPKLMSVRSKLDYLKGFIDPEDLVVFSFSGHGIANSDGKGFLVMADSYVGDLFGSSLKVEEIVTWLKEIKVKKSLLLLDACRERIQKGKNIQLNGLKVERFRQAEVAAAFFSTKSGWFSYEEEKEGTFGIFTKYVIEGLKGRADNPGAEGNGDGIVTFSELGAYVEEAVANWALKEERRQKPYTKIYGEKFGDLALSTYTASKSDTYSREIFTLRVDRVVKNGGAVKSAFKFPEKISYKLFKNGRFMGECQFIYNEKTSKKGISSLKLKDFQGLGITSKESLISYIFSDDLALYASFLKGGAKVISEVRLSEVMGFDGKKKNKFIFKDIYADDEIQRMYFIGHNFIPIDLLSALLVASQRVASGRYKSKESFNLIFDKRIRVVDMVYLGREKIPFQGKEVSSEVLAIVYNNVELFRLNLFKDNKGYCFPVEISFVDFVSKAGKASESNINRRPQKVYISNLSFMDVLTQTAMSQPKFAEMIDYAVIKGMMDAQRNIPDLAVNDPYHRIPNTDANVNTLVNTVFDPNLTEREKYNNLIKLMALYNIDVLVTGHYIDDAKSQLISIRPIIFTKSSPAVLVKNLQFTKEELWCEDPNNRGQVLCPVAFDQIAQAVQDLLGQI